MTRYIHKQVGYLMLVVALIIALIYFWIFITIPIDEARGLIFGVMFFVVFVLSIFSSLTVSIDEKYVRLKFTYGFLRKKFDLKEIQSVKAVKNHWYYGYGIKFFMWPKMWIFNVSGFDAVELVMKNGKIYRIGTDTPHELEIALNQAIHI